MMKKRLSESLICIVMVLSMLTTFALAADETVPEFTPSGIGMLTAPTAGGDVETASIVYYGGVPWYVLDLAYGVDSADDTDTGVLLLSQYAFSWRTQWMAYYNDSNAGDTGGYLGSDIRGYLTGGNDQASGKGAGTDTFTALRNAMYYGDELNTTNYSNYWLRKVATGSGSCYVKDMSNLTISTSSKTIATEALFNTAVTYNDLYIKVEDGASGDDVVEYKGAYYKTVTEYTDSTTNYYWDMTPYVPVNSLEEGQTGYTFSRISSSKWASNGSNSTVRAICAYAGYWVTDLSSKTGTEPTRELVAGESTTARTFAMDLGLTEADAAAILPTTRGGLSSTSSSYSNCYGGALDDDTFFLLDIDEAYNSNYGLGSTNYRKAYYWSAQSTQATWWLRSTVSYDKAAYIGDTGSVKTDHNANAIAHGIRPAFNLNPDQVLFTSAVNGGKSALSNVATFSPLTTSETTSFKLTLKNNSIDTPVCDLLKQNADGSYTIKYHNGVQGESNYVSAVIMDAAGNIYGYAKLGDSSTGVATLVMPEGISLGEDYTLYIFNEECSVKDTGTDYASELVKCSTISTLTGIAVTTYKANYNANTKFDASDIEVTATYSNGQTLVLGANDYTVSMPESYLAAKGFQCAGGAMQTLVVTATENTSISSSYNVRVDKVILDDVASPTASSITYETKLSESTLSDSGWTWAAPDTVPTVTNSGYEAYYVIDDAVNYDWTRVPGYDEENGRLVRTILVTVEKKEVDVPTIASKVYTGQLQTADVLESTYYTVTENAGGTNVGTYSVVLTLVDSKNYRWPANADLVESSDAAIALEFTIEQSTTTVTGNAVTATYGDVITLSVSVGPSPVATFSFFPEEEYVSFYCGETHLGTVLVNNGVAVLDYDTTEDGIPTGSEQIITAYYGGNDDLATAQGSLTATITAKDISDAVITLGGSLTYTGSEQTQTVSGVKIDGLTVTYAVTNNTGTNAGSYTLTVTGSGNFTGTATKEWSIAKDDYNMSGITFANGEFTYDGSAHSLQITGTLPTGADGITVTVTYSKTATNVADSGVVTATFATESTNYNVPEAMIAELTIAPKAITPAIELTIPDGGYVYDGDTKKPGVKVKDGDTVIDASKYTVEYADNINAGTNSASVTVTDKDGGNYTLATSSATFTINKAKANIIVDTMDIVKTYGDEWDLPDADSNFGTVKVDKTVEQMANAGTYTVTFTVEGTDNYDGDTKSVNVTIKKAQVTKPTADGTVFTYTGSEQTYAVAANDAYTVTGNKRTNAGSQTVTVALNDKANYEWADGGAEDVTFTFTIKAKDITGAEITLGDSLTYTGNQQTQTVNGVKIGELVVTYTVSNNTGTDAGDYTLTVTGSGNFTGTATAKWSIAKATPAVTIVASRTAMIGGGTAKLTVSLTPAEGDIAVTCNVAGITLMNSGNGTWTAKLPNSTQSYTFTAAYAGSTNYNAASASCTVSVTQYNYVPTESSTYTVTANDTENGEVTLSTGSATKGATVTVTVTPDEGYELETLSVTDAEGNEIALDDLGNGAYTFTMPAGKVTVTAAFAAEEQESEPCDGGEDCLARKFTDVDTAQWYHEGVDFAVERGLMNGTGNGTTFSPYMTTTRGMLVTLLYRLEGCPAVDGANPFSDVPAGQYYSNAVLWASQNGIVNGNNGKYTPNGELTREQLFTMLWRYAKYKGYDVSVGEDTNILSYNDVDKIADYAIPAMQWAVGAGYVQGNAGSLMPTGNADRVTAATLLMRFIQSIK